MILREKDLTEEEYRRLAVSVMEICGRYRVPCILHSFIGVALTLSAEAVHLPLFLLRAMTEEEKESFPVIGASCHSAEEAMEAEQLGCTYITAGHIFETDCKGGVPGRGLEFLRKICESVSVPVYGIGGIDRTNYGAVRRAGAKGACIMSGLMCCENVKDYMEELEHGA